MNADFEPTLTQPSLSPPPSPTPSTNRGPLRSLFWPGFAVGFLLLSLVSCGGLFVATGLNRIGLEDIQGGGVAWTPPAIVPTATAEVAPSPDVATSGTFTPGELVRNITSGRVNIRQTPGHQNKLPNDIIVQVDTGAILQIIEGPRMVDNLNWWLIRTEGGNGVEGWVAEATQSGVTILGR